MNMLEFAVPLQHMPALDPLRRWNQLTLSIFLEEWGSHGLCQEELNLMLYL